MVVAAINSDGHSFLVFSGLTCHLEDTGINVFCLYGIDGKETESGSFSISQEASQSAGNNTRVVLVLCSA